MYKYSEEMLTNRDIDAVMIATGDHLGVAYGKVEDEYEGNGRYPGAEQCVSDTIPIG